MNSFDRIWLVLLIVLALPLTYYRGQFRKIVNQTDSWTVYFKHSSWREFKALFGNTFPENERYLMARNTYRLLLLVYSLLMALFVIFHHF